MSRMTSPAASSRSDDMDSLFGDDGGFDETSQRPTSPIMARSPSPPPAASNRIGDDRDSLFGDDASDNGISPSSQRPNSPIIARSPSSAPSSNALDSLFGDDASDDGNFDQTSLSSNHESSSRATTPSCSPPKDSTKEISAKNPVDASTMEPARDGDSGFGFLSNGRLRIHDDEIDLHLDGSNRRAAVEDLVEYICPLSKTLTMWDRNDREDDDLWAEFPDDEKREQEVAEWKVRDKMAYLAEVDARKQAEVEARSEWYREMGVAPPSPEADKTRSKEYDQSSADMFVASVSHGDTEMTEAPNSETSEVPNIDDAFADYFAAEDEHGDQMDVESAAELGDSYADDGPEKVNQGLDEAFAEYYDEHDENDDQVIVDSAAQSAGHSHDENAFSPPSLPRGDSHIPNGNAVSTSSSFQAPSPQALGGFDKTPEQYQRTAAEEAVRKAGKKAPSKADNGKGQGMTAIDGDAAVPEPGESARQKRQRLTKARRKGPVHVREKTPDFESGALPRMYHQFWRDRPDFKILVKHVDLQINIDLKDCYLSLGLNRCRGQDIIERIRAYLQTPGNSIRIDDGSTDAWKLKISKVSHHLLVTERWGADEFDRPGLNLPKDKQVRFAEDSTKVFIAFTKLFYKVAKGEDKRRKAIVKRREHKVPGAGAVQSQPVPAPIIDLTDDSNGPAPTAPMMPQQQQPIDLTSDADKDPAPTAPLTSQQQFVPSPFNLAVPQPPRFARGLAAPAASISSTQNPLVVTRETGDPFVSPTRLMQQQHLYPRPFQQNQPSSQQFRTNDHGFLLSAFEQCLPPQSQQPQSQNPRDVIPQRAPQQVWPQQPQASCRQVSDISSPQTSELGVPPQFRLQTSQPVTAQTPLRQVLTQQPQESRPQGFNHFSPQTSQQVMSETPQYFSPGAPAQYQVQAQTQHFPPQAPQEPQELRTPSPPQQSLAQTRQPQPGINRNDPLLTVWLALLTPEQKARMRAAGMEKSMEMFNNWKMKAASSSRDQEEEVRYKNLQRK